MIVVCRSSCMPPPRHTLLTLLLVSSRRLKQKQNIIDGTIQIIWSPFVRLVRQTDNFYWPDVGLIYITQSDGRSKYSGHFHFTGNKKIRPNEPFLADRFPRLWLSPWVLTSDFQGHVRVVRDQLEDLLVDGVFQREAVHSDYLVSDLKHKEFLLIYCIRFQIQAF